MKFGFSAPILILAAGIAVISGCRDQQPKNQNQTPNTADNTTAAAPSNPSEYQDFMSKFKMQKLPVALPMNADTRELDRKYVKDLLSFNVTPAFGTEDVLPGLADNMDAAKYFAVCQVKLDSFTGFVIYKQGEDDYYYLCLFDKGGRVTDGMCIAFKEGTDADGTIRESSLNEDGSIEISQYNVSKGKPEREGSERHFYEITNQGKIHDLKSNSEPSHA